MTEPKQYKVKDLHTSIDCRTRTARKGDTFSVDEVIKPSILPHLENLGKIEVFVPVKPKATPKSKPSSKAK